MRYSHPKLSQTKRTGIRKPAFHQTQRFECNREVHSAAADSQHVHLIVGHRVDVGLYQRDGKVVPCIRPCAPVCQSAERRLPACMLKGREGDGGGGIGGEEGRRIREGRGSEREGGRRRAYTPTSRKGSEKGSRVRQNGTTGAGCAVPARVNQDGTKRKARPVFD